MIGRDPDMGRAVLQHAKYGLHDTAGRADLDAATVQMPWTRRVVLPEDLVGSVDKMNHHVPSVSQPRAQPAVRHLRTLDTPIHLVGRAKRSSIHAIAIYPVGNRVSQRDSYRDGSGLDTHCEHAR